MYDIQAAADDHFQERHDRHMSAEATRHSIEDAERILEDWRDRGRRHALVLHLIDEHGRGDLTTEGLMYLLVTEGIADSDRTGLHHTLIAPALTHWVEGDLFVIFGYDGEGDPDFVAFDTESGKLLASDRGHQGALEERIQAYIKGEHAPDHPDRRALANYRHVTRSAMKCLSTALAALLVLALAACDSYGPNRPDSHFPAEVRGQWVQEEGGDRPRISVNVDHFVAQLPMEEGCWEYGAMIDEKLESRVTGSRGPTTYVATHGPFRDTLVVGQESITLHADGDTYRFSENLGTGASWPGGCSKVKP